MLKNNYKMKIITIISIIFLSLSLFFLVKLPSNKKLTNNNSYTIENKTYYEVILKPNNYFTNNKLNANSYYITNAIKDIDIYFNYYLKNDTKENITYSYNITATLKSYADKGTKLIWTKDFNIDSSNNLTGKEIAINKKYSIDYNYYVEYTNLFQNYYNLTSDTYLYVNLNIIVNNEVKPSITLTIPINEKVMEITMKEDNDFLNNNTKDVNINHIMAFIFISLAIILIIININLNKDNDYYLKEYNDYIIILDTKPIIKSNNIIYINNLKDLIILADNNNLNIFNYQNNYFVIKDNTYFIYIN